MNVHGIAIPHASAAVLLEPVPDFDRAPIVLRTACREDAGEIHALIEEHVEEGRLLPRRIDELGVRASRFVVAASGDRLLGCAELAPLSATVSEVRSLVVHRDARHDGVGRRLVAELARRARVGEFDTLCAFTHDPGYFVRMGFSIVPHHWVQAKIVVDCQACPLFRTCGQHAVVLPLAGRPRANRI